MVKYLTEDALLEMDRVQTLLLQKTEEHLENSDVREVAKILTLVTRELYRTDEEARRLRLTGELEPGIYNIISRTYHDIASRIMELSCEYKLGDQVSTLHKSMRFARDALDTYLAEYLRSVSQ